MVNVTSPILPGAGEIGVWCSVGKVNHATESLVGLGCGPQPVPLAAGRVADACDVMLFAKWADRLGLGGFGGGCHRRGSGCLKRN